MKTREKVQFIIVEKIGDVFSVEEHRLLNQAYHKKRTVYKRATLSDAENFVFMHENILKKRKSIELLKTEYKPIIIKPKTG